MPEEVNAVQEPVQQSDDQMIDAVLDKAYGEANQGEPAPESATTEPETTEEPTAPTETEEGSEELEQGKVKDPVRERLAKQRDAERAKNAELAKRVEEFEAKLSNFQKVVNTPEFIRTEMKAQGYTDDAINNRLKSMGHEVPDIKPDVFSLIKSKLGINPDDFDPQYKQGLSETEKVIDLILEDRLSRILPSQIAPLEKSLTEMQRKSSSAELLSTMKNTVQEEGILNFDKDVVPALEKFIDANPRATQEDLKQEFVRINHAMALDRLRTKTKKDDRDVKKEVLKGKVVEGATSKPGKFSWDDSKPSGYNLDALLDNAGIR